MLAFMTAWCTQVSQGIKSHGPLLAHARQSTSSSKQADGSLYHCSVPKRHLQTWNQHDWQEHGRDVLDAITKFLKCNGFWTDFGLEVSNMDARPRADVGECRVLLPRALPSHAWGDRRRPAGPPAQTPEASSRHKTSKLPGTRLSSLRVMRPSQCRSAWARRLWVRGEKDDVLSAGLCLALVFGQFSLNEDVEEADQDGRQDLGLERHLRRAWWSVSLRQIGQNGQPVPMHAHSRSSCRIWPAQQPERAVALAGLLLRPASSGSHLAPVGVCAAPDACSGRPCGRPKPLVCLGSGWLSQHWLLAKMCWYIATRGNTDLVWWQTGHCWWLALHRHPRHEGPGRGGSQGRRLGQVAPCRTRCCCRGGPEDTNDPQI